MIKLLAVDDSALMRRLLAEIFAEAGDFEITFARDGVEALALLPQVRPDVVTLDIQMPQLDGLACLDRIMLEQPCPVVMFSSLTAEGAAETLEALSLGAVDFALKPGGAVSLKVDAFGPALVEKVRAAAGARVASSHRLAERVRLRTGAPRPLRSRSSRQRPTPKPLKAGKALTPGERLLVIGCSTGGPQALDMVLGSLPADFPWPVVVAQHMPASFTGALARRLDGFCALSVREVVRPEPLQSGTVYIGRGDADLLISRRDETLIALPAPSSAEYRWHPSVDRLVDSAVAVLPPDRLVGVLMTGMGNDGASAMARARAGGARIVAEAEETAVVWGMPGELVRAGGAEFIDPLEAIAPRLLALAAA